MDTKSITAVIIGLMVSGLILVAFVPIFTEVTATEDTFKNVGYYDMVYSETDDLTFEWDYTKPAQVTINSEVVELPVADSTPKTILCGDNWIVRYAFADSTQTYVQFYGSSGSNVTASVTDATTLTVTCSSGSVSVTNDADTPATFSTTYTHLYVVDNSGTFVMKQGDSSAYLNGDSEIFAMGLSRVGTIPNMGILIEGTIDDGFTWSMFRGSDVTFSDESAEYTTVSGYIDLYSLSQLTATGTNSTGSTELVYSYFIVPAEVTAEKSVHGDDAFNAIINIIPLLAGVGLLMAGVYYFISRK